MVRRYGAFDPDSTIEQGRHGDENMFVLDAAAVAANAERAAAYEAAVKKAEAKEAAAAAAKAAELACFGEWAEVADCISDCDGLKGAELTEAVEAARKEFSNPTAWMRANF